MAANLVKAGFDVSVYDARTAEATRFALEVGGKAAPALGALGESSEVVITMLPTSRSSPRCSSTKAASRRGCALGRS